GQAGGGEHRKLEVFPLLLEYRAVPAQAMLHPLRLPAEFIIGKEVRFVRRQRAATIDAAGTEAFRPGAVDHLVIGELVGQVDAAEVIVFLGGLVEVGARRALELVGAETCALAGGAAVTGAEAEETLEAVLGM